MEVTVKWSILALTVVQMIGLASVASAESAWVLWSKSVMYHALSPQQMGDTEGIGIAEIGGRFWEAENAFNDRQQCVKEATNYISMLENFKRKNENATVRKDELAGRTRLHVDDRDQNIKTVLSAVCLPEMVDPRPRAKE